MEASTSPRWISVCIFSLERTQLGKIVTGFHARYKKTHITRNNEPDTTTTHSKAVTKSTRKEKKGKSTNRETSEENTTATPLAHTSNSTSPFSSSSQPDSHPEHTLIEIRVPWVESNSFAIASIAVVAPDLPLRQRSILITGHVVSQESTDHSALFFQSF